MGSEWNLLIIESIDTLLAEGEYFRFDTTPNLALCADKVIDVNTVRR